ncbi:MAG: MTH1187 family thiamine-binding protein [Bacillota bacterium]
MNVVAEISIVPLGTGSPGIGRFVAACVEVLRRRGVKYQVTPMGTVVEGELDAVLDAVREMHEVPFRAGAERVVTTVHIDDRRDKALTVEGKVRSVEERLAAGCGTSTV